MLILPLRYHYAWDLFRGRFFVEGAAAQILSRTSAAAGADRSHSKNEFAVHTTTWRGKRRKIWKKRHRSTPPLTKVLVTASHSQHKNVLQRYPDTSRGIVIIAVQTPTTTVSRYATMHPHNRSAKIYHSGIPTCQEASKGEGGKRVAWTNV